jgi:hypothetical protein
MQSTGSGGTPSLQGRRASFRRDIHRQGVRERVAQMWTQLNAIMHKPALRELYRGILFLFIGIVALLLVLILPRHGRLLKATDVEGTHPFLATIVCIDI